MGYKNSQIDDWHGRIDSDTDFDAFRWHQWVKPLSIHQVYVPLPNLSIGFIGFSCDEGIKLNKGRQGAALGPKVLRRELSNLPCLFTKEVQLFDCGDIVHQGEDLEYLQSELADAIEKMLSLGLFPIVLGGGHELAHGHFTGLKRHFNRVSIVNFDAHLDMRPYPNGPSSGTMFLQIAHALMAENQPFNYLCLGIQRRGNTVSLIKTAKAHGAIYRYATDMIHEPYGETLNILNDYLEHKTHIYATLCTDVISSAFAPGVSAAQPLGLHPEMILTLLKEIVATGKLIAFDVAEVSPRYDQDNVTANLASTFIFGLVNALAAYNGFGIDI